MVWKPKGQQETYEIAKKKQEEEEKAETEELLRKAVNAKDESFIQSNTQTPVKEEKKSTTFKPEAKLEIKVNEFNPPKEARAPETQTAPPQFSATFPQFTSTSVPSTNLPMFQISAPLGFGNLSALTAD